MSINLLEILGKEVTGGLAKNAAGFLGESEGGITKALGSAFPAILGSMMKKGSDESGAGELLDLIKGQDTGFMNNIGDLFGSSGGMLDTVLGSGGGILKMLMGDKVGGIVDPVSKAAGIGKSSTGKLLKMAAPFLIGTIGKQVMKKGLNIGGLMDLLGGQKKHVEAVMPSGFGDLLGLGGLLKGVSDLAGDGVDAGKKVAGAGYDAGKKVAGAAAGVGSAAVDTVGKTGSGLMKWLIPAIIVLALLSYFGFKTGCNAVDSVSDKAVSATESVATGAGELAKDAADATVKGAQNVSEAAGDAASTVASGFAALFSKVDAAAKKALDALTFTAGSAADQFNKFIDGGAKGEGVFKFKNLTFATGSAQIDAASALEVDHIAAILKAYPEVKVALEGHTDKTGNADTNMSLSKSRAESVKGRLIAAGIAPARLSAIGYGSTRPVSATSTNDENRRIEVRIVK